MRLAVTCAVLIVLALDLGLGQEEERAPGVPWVARMELGGYQLLTAPEDSPSPEAYQVNMLHGITAQPWTLVLLHAAWRYRETLAPGFTKPFREPLGWQGSGTVSLIPDFFFAWGAVNWPTGNSTSPLADSNAWSTFLSEHATLPDLSIASSPTVQVGAMIRIQSDPSLFLAGLSYQRPASFTGLQGNRFRTPWIMGLKLRCDLPLWDDRQRIDFSGNLFGPEVTGDGREAHQEGLSTQISYSAFGLGRDRLWVTALGVKVKWKDANRKIMLDIPPEKTELNDNLQAAYCEIAKNLTGSLWFIHWAFINRIEAQWRPSDDAVYLENTLDIRGFRKVFTHYGLETRLKGLAGEFNGGTYFGVGVTCVFTFRHLGLASNRMDISPTP